jgi:citrate/tricarballylate utilization protein
MDATRLLRICNACRYCEGYCAVFPAIEMRRAFTSGDLSYLANLCHDCRGCFYACQYAPPHEFGLNLPQTFARLRAETYQRYAWPGALAVLFQRNAAVVTATIAFGITLLLVLMILLVPAGTIYVRNSAPGAFYAVIPEIVMVGAASATLGFALLSIAIGVTKFWRDCGYAGPEAHSIREALWDVLTLRNLGGGGHGCNDQNELFSNARRRWHQFLMYGFSLCLASTSTAAIYEHALGRLAPYPFLSIPVLLGTAGGIGMVIGSAGLWRVKVSRDSAPDAPELQGADYGLLILMFLSAATGLVLLLLRETSAMGILLAIHLGVILSFFVVLPYSKFVHGVYRAAALLRSAAERAVTSSGEKLE